MPKLVELFNRTMGQNVPKSYKTSPSSSGSSVGKATTLASDEGLSINENLSRYTFLLKDSQSPIISNFVNMVDDNVCTYEEFCELYDVAGTLKLKQDSVDLL